MVLRAHRKLLELALPLSFSLFAYAEPYCTDLMDKEANPLGQYQWHLYNHGNEAFATPYTDEQKSASMGQDINAYEVLKNYCLSGSGVRVAVLDTGLEIAHPSLSPNVKVKAYKDATWSVNYRNNNLRPNDPSPVYEDKRDHGTMVAGIIGMRSNQGFGGSGVAPRSELTGYNILSRGAQTFANFFEALGSSDASKNNDVFNMSYGMGTTFQVMDNDPIEMASLSMYKTGTRLLRNGKGGIYVKAAGNGFANLTGSYYDYFICSSATKYHVSCQNSNMNPDNAIPEVITVGALNSFGKKTSYSTTGSSLWISAPGGEHAFNKVWITEQYSRFNEKPSWPVPTIGEPAIVTTDMMGSRIGVAHMINLEDSDDIFNIGNEFNAGLVQENENFNYTNSMNGTSSATPVTSGAIAVMLEANPNLSWRDVKYILASTATKVDPDFEGVTVELGKGPFQLEQGWVKNAAGYEFSNWYGFGRINLKAAVEMAQNYHYPLGKYIERPWWPLGKSLNLNVPASDYNGVERVVNVSSRDNLVVESVQIKLSMESSYLGDLSIELTSPSGTKSIVWHAGNGFSDIAGDEGKFFDGMIMQSNAFYGEDSAGDWKVRVINTGIHKATTVWSAFQLKVTGYERG